MTDYYLHLPYDTLYEIAMKLPIRDVVNQCNTSSRLREICKNQEFWRKRVEQDFGLDAINWKQLYIDESGKVEQSSAYWLQKFVNDVDPKSYAWKEKYIKYLNGLDRSSTYWRDRYIKEVDPQLESWKDKYLIYTREDHEKDNIYWQNKFKDTFRNPNINWRGDYFKIMKDKFAVFIDNLIPQITNINNKEQKLNLSNEYFEFLIKNKDILDLPEFKAYKHKVMDTLRTLFIDNNLPNANDYYYRLFGRRLYTLPAGRR